MLYLNKEFNNMVKKVFAFDMGKASIGYCAREGLKVLELGSLIIDKDHAEIVSNRDRKRVFKTLQAHKAREKFFNDLWKFCNLEPLQKESELFKKEFGKKQDKTIYNSTLLRIALLQNIELEEWQIYKALHSTIQRRGYDANLAWANANSDDEKENKKRILEYTTDINNNELITNDEYKYPCYYDAKRLSLWNENNPNELKTYVPAEMSEKVRTAGIVAPREMVEKELRQLYLNAQKQLPELKKYSADYFLYGISEKAYASYLDNDYKKYRGTNWEWESGGVLGQKIPRFDNRIIAKCKLLPKRNVCKAETLENVSLVLLMKLKNLRFTDVLGEKSMLSADAIKQIYENWQKKATKNDGSIKLDTTITKQEIEKVIEEKILEKIEPMKAKLSGRSSFCRRACQIMCKIILEGIENPATMDIAEFIDNIDTKNGITEEELRTMLSKVGKWDNLYIPDNRYEMAEMASDEREKTDILIGNITNAIVRNRLQIFRDKILELKHKHGIPDEVIFEFVRDDNSLFGTKKVQAHIKTIKDNEDLNNKLAQQLKDTDCFSAINLEKMKLLERQGGICIYSGQKIGISDLDKCEIDHIYPRSKGGNDAISNKVLCYAIENQKKKGQTPYEWLHNNEELWNELVTRVTRLQGTLGKTKVALLTSKPEECQKLVKSYNGLAETAQIARVAQDITAFIFGWGLQLEGEKRRIFVNNGATTSAIRKTYRLNKLLGNDVKKNRQNDKHHALDAICISFSRAYKYNAITKRDEIEGLDIHDNEFKDLVKKSIDDLLPYPYTNDKPFKGNLRPLETIYGYRKIGYKNFITQRIDITSIEQKDKKIKSIIDEVIKNDLLNKLEDKMSSKDWSNMLSNYIHPTKMTKVKKVLVVVSEGDMSFDENGRARIGEYADFGTKGTKHQFKHSKGHKGQILYYNEKNVIKVMPIFANQKLDEVKEKLEQINCKLYKKGMMFYSGCLIKVDKEFEGTAYYTTTGENGKEKQITNKETLPAGVYKLRTLMSDGKAKLESPTGTEILTSAKNLTNSEFKKLTK